jgi:predicted nucleotide-binding protein (sugar kinase/HSP70/actin superfamily)
MMATILYGGLTKTHEILIKGAVGHLGFEAKPLPTPDNEALKIGKEYCNKGQCNPTYYTVGNLIKYLSALRDQGVRDIEQEYLFVTADSCGPCRFGMYDLEYKRAVKEAGFKDFKIITFEQTKALENELKEMGLSFDKNFFIALTKAVVAADLINDIYYKTKPYETVPKSLDLFREKAINLLYEAFSGGKSIFLVLKRVKKELDGIEVDYFQPKPKVKITGEFFAQTTEGDGNYKLASWLIEEGAEPLVEPVTTWIDYIIWEKITHLKERAFRNRFKYGKEIILLQMLQGYLHGLYRFYRLALGNKPDSLKKQKKIEQYAKAYFNPKISGGEGHMEIGKHIYMNKHKMAHMVISVKPFGCMPSTQSDGVQIKVMEDLGGSLFVPLETTGDAEVNTKSRVLMKLYEAKIKTQKEYETAKEKLQLTTEKIVRLSEKNRYIKKGSLKLSKKVISTAGNALYLLE